jgi:hypothetical protein
MVGKLAGGEKLVETAMPRISNPKNVSDRRWLTVKEDDVVHLQISRRRYIA